MTFVQGLAGFYLTKLNVLSTSLRTRWHVTSCPSHVSAVFLFMYTAYLLSPLIHELGHYFHLLAIGISLLWAQWSPPEDLHSPDQKWSCDFAWLVYFSVSEKLSHCFLFLGMDNSQLSRLEVDTHCGFDSNTCWLEMLGTFCHLSLGCGPSLLWRNGSSWRDVLFCFVSCRVSLCVLDINATKLRVCKHFPHSVVAY